MNLPPIQFAGDATSFTRRLDRVPQGSEPMPVRPSARANRVATLPPRDIHVAAAHFLPDMEGPVPIHGHSRVAVVFGIARIPDPVHVFVSGRRALPVRESTKPIFRRAGDECVDAMEGTGRTTCRSPAFLWCTIPRIKAVVELGDSGRYRPVAPLTWSDKVFLGIDDTAVDPGLIGAWRSDAASASASHTSEVDHGVHHIHRGTVAALMGQVPERTNDAIAS